MKKILSLLLIFICIAFSCERDDICPEDTPTTPRMIVEFRDFTLPENPKNVTKLRVEDFEDENRVLEGYNIVTEDQIILPLRTDVGETKYSVYKDYNIDDNGTPDDESDDFQTGNKDIITITYEREDVYVSRACGYKTTFKNITFTIETDTDNWMLLAIPENDNQSVINEDEIHYTIRH